MNLEDLIQRRRLFELEMYDLLVSPLIFYDQEDFWEPVKIQLKKELKSINITDTCVICTDLQHEFKIVDCCNQKLCSSCSKKWFDQSVKCPYCFQDLREI